MLARWRIFLTWMLMAALPLQGLAASSMLFCVPATHQVAVFAGSEAAGHDHATHRHLATHEAKQDSASSQAASADAQHQCNLCAACCHAAGVADSLAMSRTIGSPRADLPEPPLPVAGHVAPLPERPPRA